MTKYCLINGQLVPEDSAGIKISDLALRRGLGIFDYLRVRNGVPLYLERHLDRFVKGAADAGMLTGFGKDELRRQIATLISSSDLYEEGAVRLTLTGGESAWEPVSPNVIITYEKLKGFDEQLYSSGAAVITHAFLRELSHIKTISYMTAISLNARMKQENAIEVLYHRDGLVTEFSRSNLFMVRDNRLLTPGKNILPGITRSVILEIAGDVIETQVTDIRPAEIYDADELFMTSTIKRIIPVVAVDGQQIGAGKPGSVTRKMITSLEKRDEQELSFSIQHKQS